MSDKKPQIVELLEADKRPLGAVGSPSDSFETIVDILEISEESKLLGELVCFTVKEGTGYVLVLGQITEIKTENRWHEEPSFKGIIKRHGMLPNLSGVADNRIAKINVQSSFQIPDNDSHKYEAHKLANSPSTGVPVKKISNDIMQELMRQYEKGLVSLGTAYDTKVNVPFWFKHFGKPEDGGGGDAYHIGVFGRTGSGKTTTAANMILGYARSHEQMSILILDPQEQFYEDNNVLPGNTSFEEKITDCGMKYDKYKVPDDVALPNNARLFSELLLSYGFIKSAFAILSEEKREAMREAIEAYISRRIDNGHLEIAYKPPKLYEDLLKYFLNEEDNKPREPLEQVYSQSSYITKVKDAIKDSLSGEAPARTIWKNVCLLFSKEGKKALEDLVDTIVTTTGNTIVLNISGRGVPVNMENIQTLYVKIIEDAIKKKGSELFGSRKQSNCLVVLDEAHRFISTYTYNESIKELTTSIIDAVRTTRKYGIGYMFITQTIDSLHEEIRRQIRIFAFGYGLTSGSEFAKVKETRGDYYQRRRWRQNFVRSFIDPASNKKFPFNVLWTDRSLIISPGHFHRFRLSDAFGQDPLLVLCLSTFSAGGRNAKRIKDNILFCWNRVTH